MASLVKSVVNVDGVYYGVQQGTYVRRWTRSFSSNLAANIVRLNFVDRGPGIRVYDFQINCINWTPNSLPFQEGATGNFDLQRSSIEASYAKIATPLTFFDIFNEPPTLSGSSTTSIGSGDTVINITSALANLLSIPPNADQTYPYPMYIWAPGTSLGYGIANNTGIEVVQVTGINGNQLSVTRSAGQNWNNGVNLGVAIGVYMTNMNQTEVPDMTSANPRVTYDIELTEAVQVVNP